MSWLLVSVIFCMLVRLEMKAGSSLMRLPVASSTFAAWPTDWRLAGSSLRPWSLRPMMPAAAAAGGAGGKEVGAGGRMVQAHHTGLLGILPAAFQVCNCFSAVGFFWLAFLPAAACGGGPGRVAPVACACPGPEDEGGQQQKRLPIVAEA